MSSPMNPLLNLHQQADAETQFYDQIEIVSTFGVPQAEYAAIRKSCGIIDLPQRGILELTGKDRHAFLNNLISNNVWDKTQKKGLDAGQTRYAFLLNLKGRVVLDMTVIELGDRTLLDLDVRLVDMLAKLLDKYLFAEQVKIVSRVGELHQFALHGPGVGTILQSEGIAGVLSAAEHVSSGRIIGKDVVLWRNDQCAVPGFHMITNASDAEVIWNHLLTRHGGEIELGKRALRPVGWAAWNACRIEAGTPLFGIDFELAEPAVPGAKAQAGEEQSPRAAGVLPAETGLLDRAVSFVKGCYLGQEVVARMHARGQVARKLVGLKLDNGMLPIAGEHVFDDKQNQIGAITSSTMSPVLSDAAIALAIVKKPHFEPGKVVHVPAEGAMREAKVVELPFVRVETADGRR
jgi:folate-binding protein YgfZ